MGKEARLHGVPDGLGPGVPRAGVTVRTKSAQAGLCDMTRWNEVCQDCLRRCLCSDISRTSPRVQVSKFQSSPYQRSPAVPCTASQCISNIGYGMFALVSGTGCL